MKLLSLSGHRAGRIVVAACLAICLGLANGAGASAKEKNPMVKLTTSMGEIQIEIYTQKAPETAANFLQYVKEGHYNGTIFHRVINGFMIQGGGFTPELKQKPTRSGIENEADNLLKNEAYTLAMARTMDPHSASAQFFINVDDNDFLNHTAKTDQGWGYCVFAKVVQGREVVDQIKAVETGTFMGYEDVPKKTVIIEKAEVLEE